MNNNLNEQMCSPGYSNTRSMGHELKTKHESSLLALPL